MLKTIEVSLSRALIATSQMSQSDHDNNLTSTVWYILGYTWSNCFLKDSSCFASDIVDSKEVLVLLCGRFQNAFEQRESVSSLAEQHFEPEQDFVLWLFWGQTQRLHQHRWSVGKFLNWRTSSAQQFWGQVQHLWMAMLSKDHNTQPTWQPVHEMHQVQQKVLPQPK